MMRELFRNKLGLAVLAGLGLSAAASSANAALITFEVRTAGTGLHAATVANPGDVVNLELVAHVQNNDADHANDGFSLLHSGMLSVDSGLLGNEAPFTLNGSLLDTGVSATGSQLNRDANPDLEIGGTDVNVQTGWIVFSTGTSTKFGSGAGAGTTDFLLGTTTWTYTGGTGSTSLNIDFRVRTTGVAAAKQLVKYTTDGVAHSEDAGTAPGNVNAMLGAPVVVNVVPEPAALGLLGLGGLAALRRRRA